jgi:hypothetical protein
VLLLHTESWLERIQGRMRGKAVGKQTLSYIAIGMHNSTISIKDYPYQFSVLSTLFISYISPCTVSSKRAQEFCHCRLFK